MSTFVNRIFRFSMAAALMGVAVVSASAQQAQFHLPFQAKWAGIVLPPGDYRVSMPERALGRFTMLVRGPAGASLILPMTADIYRATPEQPSGRYLQLVKVDGEYFVKKYEAGAGGLTLFFKTPKPNRSVQITAQDFANIPVSGE
jgi:hypothetical protein